MRCLIFSIFSLIVLLACQGSDSKALVAGEKKSGQERITDSSKFTTIQWLDSTSRNFGKIPEGQKLEVSYKFRNSGDQPLVIERVQPSCGCTVAEQPTEPIAPGKEGVIKALFTSENHPGQNNKTIFVFANTRGNRNHELRFAVEVEKKKW